MSVDSSPNPPADVVTVHNRIQGARNDILIGSGRQDIHNSSPDLCQGK